MRSARKLWNFSDNGNNFNTDTMIQDFILNLFVLQLKQCLICGLCCSTFPNKLQFGIIDFT